MRSEFLSAVNDITGISPGPWEQFTTTLQSTARIEQYPWMSSVPGLKEYRGYRQFGNIDSVKYEVANKEYSAEFLVRTRDVEDDQVGGYKLKPQELVKKAKEYPGRLVMRTLAAGKTTRCFDGSYLFANSHTIGTGDNLLAGTAAGSDGVANRLLVMVTTGVIKPAILQDRKPLSQLMTNEGTPASQEEKQIKYWVDCEMAVAYGFWWDAVLLEWTNTPTLTEIQTELGNIENAFRSFKLPKGMDTDEDEYVHEQLAFSTANTTTLCSTGIANKMRTVLNSETIVQSGAAVSNMFRGWSNLIPTAYLN